MRCSGRCVRVARRRRLVAAVGRTCSSRDRLGRGRGAGAAGQVSRQSATAARRPRCPARSHLRRHLRTRRHVHSPPLPTTPTRRLDTLCCSVRLDIAMNVSVKQAKPADFDCGLAYMGCHLPRPASPFVIISASLSINIASVRAIGIEHSPRSSVGLCVCVCRSGKCTVAKRLSGSRCRLGDEWGRLRDGCIRLSKGKRLFGVNLGRPIVTSGDFVA